MCDFSKCRILSWMACASHLRQGLNMVSFNPIPLAVPIPALSSFLTPVLVPFFDLYLLSPVSSAGRFLARTFVSSLARLARKGSTPCRWREAPGAGVPKILPSRSLSYITVTLTLRKATRLTFCAPGRAEVSMDREERCFLT